MATVLQPSVENAVPFNRATPVKEGAHGLPTVTALVPLPAELAGHRKSEEQYALLKGIPVEVDVAIPIRRFQVRNVLALAAGQLIASRWVEGEDVPLAAHGARLAWTEIEVIDQKLAVRITRLA